MTKKIRKKKSPGGRLLNHKIKNRNQKSHCRICGTLLHISRKKESKSRKHADRSYGGELCHACLRTSIQTAKLN